MSYSIQIYLNKLTCRDTESVHSSDKVGIAGAVRTDLDGSGFVFPSFRINDHHPDDVHSFESAKIFDGMADQPRVALSFKAWDIDANDTWVDNRDDIIAVARKISEAAKYVPVVGTAAGYVIDALSKVVPPIIDQFVKWDKNDLLGHYDDWLEAPRGEGYGVLASEDKAFHFYREDATGYSSWDYTLGLTIACTEGYPSFGSVNLTVEDAAKQSFKIAAENAAAKGFNGGFPTRHTRQVDVTTYSTYIFLRELETFRPFDNPDRILRPVSKRMDVRYSELGISSLDDFRTKMRATSLYAQQHGFVGGFPTFETDDGSLCKCVFVYPLGAERRNVRLDALGDPAPEDIEGRFIAVHDFALRERFVGGIPDYNDRVSDPHLSWPTCGVVLINARAGQSYEL